MFGIEVNPSPARFMARAVPEDNTIWNIAVRGFDNARMINDVEYMQENLRKFTKRDITFTKVMNLGEWKLNIRMAEKFCIGRVFLAGGISDILLLRLLCQPTASQTLPMSTALPELKA
jgi:hypothetical protein